MEIKTRLHGGIGDCLWEFSVLPNLKLTYPNCKIDVFLNHKFLYPLIEGIYDNTTSIESDQTPSMFFANSPNWGRIDWTQGKQLIDVLPDSIQHYYNIKMDVHYRMPYSRLFINNFHPKDFYVCFCTKTSAKDPNHTRNLPYDIFYKVIQNVNCQFIQIGEMRDEKIDLPNVIDKRGISFDEIFSIIANAGVFYGLQSGLRMIAESFNVPIVCYHNDKYSTYDLPLTKNYTHCIKGVTSKITSALESIAILNNTIAESEQYFHGCKNIIKCNTKEEIDKIQDFTTISINWNNLPLEIYAKNIAINKPIKVVLEK
jgi:hypothetical protein